MKSITARLRTLIIVVVAIVMMVVAIAAYLLGSGWITPVVNHFAQPYKVSLEHIELSWEPLALTIDDLNIGEGEQALSLKQLQVRTDWGFIFGEPLQFFVQLADGTVGYRQTKGDWSVARFKPDPMARAV